jgi:hypothetical protein
MVGFTIQIVAAKPFPAPSLSVFVALQMLDVLTTLFGLRLGAREASVFVGTLMHVGPVASLLISKIFAVLLVAVALRWQRPRLVVFLNFWFCAVVTWNLATIWFALVPLLAHGA